MKMDLTKFKKRSKILRIIINVFFWAAVFMGIFSLISIAVILLNPDSLLKLSDTGIMSISINNGITHYKIDPSTYGVDQLMPVIISVLLAVLLAASLWAIIFRQVSQILKTIEKDSPFIEKNSQRLTLIGVILIIGSLVLNAAVYAIFYFMAVSFHIANVEAVNYNFDVGMLVSGFLILILAGVFKYGSFLQQEFDSTL